MFLTIIIAFFSLIALIIIHELGHFLLAKKFGVKVEEFGIGYPPRLFGKKFGETLYSLNLLPFGAFVRIYGQETIGQGPRSFSNKKFWQKALIIVGGVVSFWLVSFILLTIVMATGAPSAVEDDENQGLVNPRVQILAVAPGSPAEAAGLRTGDVIKDFDKVKEVQDFAEENKGREITLTIGRGKEVFEISIIPRPSPPSGEGRLGIALARTALKSWPWYLAPVKGIEATASLTVAIIKGWGLALSRLFQGQPTGAELRGPVGIFDLFNQVSQLGVNYFLQFVAIVSLYIALFNILPIPVTDGGWLMFLIIEKFRGKPLNQKLVQRITGAFFFLLLALMVWVTIKDIARLL